MRLGYAWRVIGVLASATKRARRSTRSLTIRLGKSTVSVLENIGYKPASVSSQENSNEY